ncbi:hypothetical protein [Atopomonas sediminilitoris]|uniref:hypothetical protein n=1 Tax=Atopomonas sediminilitoris TaxID=2919919 RepID=UPI001F4E39C0|nr:hypothetical protein [Atopomonas sediminilitoris]MCJ8168367.1 hypothetical protein [Atopomonas sediminilitoris]
MKKATNPNIEKAAKANYSSNRSAIARVLARLMIAPMDKFDGEQIGDHALNSTISALGNRHGLTIARKMVKIAAKWGESEIALYWLEPEHMPRAAKLLEQFDAKARWLEINAREKAEMANKVTEPEGA